MIPKSPSGATAYVATRRLPDAKQPRAKASGARTSRTEQNCPLTTPLQRQRLGARVGRVLERFKMGKFIRWEVIDGQLSWSFDQNKIAAEKTL